MLTQCYRIFCNTSAAQLLPIAHSTRETLALVALTHGIHEWSIKNTGRRHFDDVVCDIYVLHYEAPNARSL